MTQLDAPPGDAPAPQDREPDPAPAPATRSDRRQAARRSRRRRTTALVVGVAALVAVVAVVVVASSSGVAHSNTVEAQPAAAPAAAPAGLVLTGRNMPDPFVLVDGSSTYLYTGGYGQDAVPHVPVRKFTDLDHVGDPSDAMPTLPAWSWGWIWTEDVDRTPAGYVMWFTSRSLHALGPQRGGLPVHRRGHLHEPARTVHRGSVARHLRPVGQHRPPDVHRHRRAEVPHLEVRHQRRPHPGHPHPHLLPAPGGRRDDAGRQPRPDRRVPRSRGRGG